MYVQLEAQPDCVRSTGNTSGFYSGAPVSTWVLGKPILKFLIVFLISSKQTVTINYTLTSSFHIPLFFNFSPVILLLLQAF